MTGLAAGLRGGSVERGEALGIQTFSRPGLDKLRGDDLKTLEGPSSLDLAVWKYHLKQSGFLGLPDLGTGGAGVLQHVSYACLESAPHRAREGGVDK